MLSVFYKYKNILITAVFAVGMSYPLFSSQTKPTNIKKIYQKRILGDKAFNSGLYDVAMSYYKQYLKNTDNDTAAARDSYYCLIATCLKASNIKEAEVFYTELKENNKEFYEKNPKEKAKLIYWGAVIKLSKGLTEEALSSFKEVASKTQKTDKSTYTNALIEEGIAEIRLQNLDAAKSSFSTVSEIAENQTDRVTAIEQIALIALIQNNISDAQNAINELVKTYGDEETATGLLNTFLLIKNNKISEAEKSYSKLNVASNKKYKKLNYLVLSEFAEYYLKSKQYNNALDKLQLAYSQAPNLYEKETVAIKTLNTMVKADKLKDAASSAKMFLDFFPKSILRDQILLMYSSILIKLNTDPKLVLGTVEKYYVFEEQPAKIQIEIALRLGKIFFEIKNYNDAIKYFQYCYKKGTNRNQCGAGIFWLAQSQTKLGDTQKAITTYEKIDSKFPEWQPKAMLELSLIYLKEKKYLKAKSILSELSNKYKNIKLTPSPIFLMAYTLSSNNEIQEAVKYYLSFAEKNKDDKLAPEAYSRAGDLDLRLADFQKAIDCYQTVLKHYPKSEIIPEVLYKLLYGYYMSGGYSKAIDMVSELNTKYPDNDYSLQASFWLVDHYISNKEYKKAKDLLGKIEVGEKDNKRVLAKVIYDKADIYSLQDKNSKALEQLELLGSFTENPEVLSQAYYLEGDIYSQNDHFDNAIEAYKKVLELKPSEDIQIAAQGRIGDCYFAVINYSDDRDSTIKLAINAYDSVLAYSDISEFLSIQTNYKLGKCYELLDQNDKAMEYYHHALYENIIDIQNDGVEKEWAAKSGLALAQIFLAENTQYAAARAIKVYEELIKLDIQPVSSYEQKIKNIKSKYNIEE